MKVDEWEKFLELEVEELLEQATNAANGQDLIWAGAIGFGGYGFVFRDPFRSRVPFITIQGSSKFCSVGLLLKRNLFQQDLDKNNVKEIYKYMEEEDNYDLLLVGSLKTLIPTLRFGGDELLFDSWVFVKTPDGKQFPATFYYRQSGLSMGGWKSNKDSSGNVVFSEEFLSIVNFNPFEFEFYGEEVRVLVQALEHALGKVSVSDFQGVFEHEFGKTLMGVKLGMPFTRELYRC